MTRRALLYHDVIDGPDPDASGLPGPGAAHYKLDVRSFRGHLDALERALAAPPLRIAGEADADRKPPTGWILTFDDGGRSALHPIAEMLDQRSWTGHFFVTAGRIDSTGFLSSTEMRELRARGHVIGSHSWSHPVRFSALSRVAMEDEWRRSLDCISQILGEAVHTASVPGGYYSRAVAEAAARAGVRVLFTSEPVTRVAYVAECLVFGRFAITRRTSAQRAAGLAAGKPAPRAVQWLAWNARKAAKRLAGNLYIHAREALLARNTSRPTGQNRGF